MMTKKYLFKDRIAVPPPLPKYSEPTIWALRKGKQPAMPEQPRLYGSRYDDLPPAVQANDPAEAIRKGSAENPNLNILNPQTNFVVMTLASDQPSN